MKIEINIERNPYVEIKMLSHLINFDKYQHWFKKQINECVLELISCSDKNLIVRLNYHGSDEITQLIQKYLCDNIILIPHYEINTSFNTTLEEIKNSKTAVFYKHFEKVSEQVLDVDKVRPPAPSTPDPENISYKRAI
jgi:hypothetical protein